MKLSLFDETYTYSNDEAGINEMFTAIMEKVEKTDFHISHLVIDGEEVYENHGEYILERLSNVENVKVIVKTTKELINETLLSTELYLQRALPEIEMLVDEFYQNPTEESWNKLGQLVEGMQWIAQMVSTIDQFEEKLANWNEYLTNIATLQNELPNLMEAMEHQDALLIADIIQYEISPIFESLQNTITETIDNEGKRPNLS